MNTRKESMRILVIDDDAMAGEMTGAVLEGLGHEVILAEDGMDAVVKLNADDGIEMIISDMNMPMISGIDLFRELREQGNTLPFILLTGDEPEGLLAQEPRLDACLLKDYGIEEPLSLALAEVRARRHKA
jgi:CheY-like chemotaxis protein